MIKLPFRRTIDKSQEALGLRQLEDAVVSALTGAGSSLVVNLDGDNRATHESVAKEFQIGHVRAVNVAAFTTTATIPYDDTLPLSSEGTEFIAVVYIPKRIGNKVRVRAWTVASASNASANVVAAMFLNNGVCASGSVWSVPTTSKTDEMVVEHEEVITSLSPQRWSVRFGTTAGTLTLNGAGGLRLLGGVIRSFIEVEEITEDIL